MKYVVRGLAVLLLVSCVVAAASAWWYWLNLQAVGGLATGSAAASEVEVPKGSSPAKIAALLQAQVDGPDQRGLHVAQGDLDRDVRVAEVDELAADDRAHHQDAERQLAAPGSPGRFGRLGRLGR